MLMTVVGSRTSSSTGGSSAVAAPAARPDGVDVDRFRLVLLRLARRIRSQYRGETTPSQMAVMATLARRGPSTVGQIADYEQVRPPSASRIVAALESLGVVQRDPDPDDRRCVQVALTAEGERVVDDARTAGATWLASRLDDLDPPDRAALADAVDVLERLLGGVE